MPPRSRRDEPVTIGVMTSYEPPWASVIPEEDLLASAAFGPVRRPLAAGSRPAVLVVDMTRQFVDSSYPMGFGTTGWPAAKAIRSLLDVARPHSVPVFYTKNYADPSYAPTAIERGMWKLSTPIQAPSHGTPPGDVIIDELAPHPSDIVIDKKDKPSAFFGTPLLSYLIRIQCDTLIVTGMVTSGCVRATVLDAFQHNFHCIVPAECTADRSQISHKVSLFDLHMKYADVVPLNEAMSYVESLRSNPEHEANAQR